MSQKHTEDEFAAISCISDEVHSSDSGTLLFSIVSMLKADQVSVTHNKCFPLSSTAETSSESSCSGESEYSSDFDSSDSFSSDSSEGSSYSNLSPEDEDMEEDNEDCRRVECIVILSDEEPMELEPPLNSAAPLTPGAQFDLGLQHWSDPFQRDEREENQYASLQQDSCDMDALMELQIRDPQDLQPPSSLSPGSMSSMVPI